MRAKRAKQIAREARKVKRDMDADSGEEHPYKYVKRQVKKAWYERNKPMGQMGPTPRNDVGFVFHKPVRWRKMKRRVA